MSLFELAWAWYEEWEYYLFVHESKTNDEFDRDVEFIVKKYAEEYLSQERSWAGLSRLIEYVAPKMDELGYKQAFKHTKSFFGGYIIDGKRESESLKSILDNNLLSKFVFHNKKIKRKNDRQMKKWLARS